MQTGPSECLESSCSVCDEKSAEDCHMPFLVKRLDRRYRYSFRLPLLKTFGPSSILEPENEFEKAKREQSLSPLPDTAGRFPVLAVLSGNTEPLYISKKLFLRSTALLSGLPGAVTFHRLSMTASNYGFFSVRNSQTSFRS